MLSKKIIQFYCGLKPPKNLPGDIEVLFPQQDGEVKTIIRQFFSKFYNDNKPRNIIFGINPGRLGAGITGINFTAPKQLSEQCGIKHRFKPSSELSAEFIYDMIHAYGGPASFYNDIFLSAICPLGFIKQGKNINYYDDKMLLKSITPYIVKNIEKQLSFGVLTERCFCIGEDKNYKFLLQLNDTYAWFDHIIPLPHPRFIMQYRRKHKEQYIQQYVSAFRFPQQ